MVSLDVQAIKSLSKKKVPDAPMSMVPPGNPAPPVAPGPETFGPNQVVRDQTTGKVTGYTDANGKFFFGSQSDILGKSQGQTTSGISPAASQPAATPQGFTEASTVAQNQAAQQLANQVGNTTPQNQPGLNQQQANQPGLNYAGALTAGLGEAAIGGTAGAAVGAITGPGAIATAAIGIVGGFIHGFVANLKKDANANIAAEFSSLQTNAKNMRLLVIDAKKDPQGSLDAFNLQLAAIDNHYSNLKLETQNNVNKFLGTNTQVEMAKLENFYAPGGLRDVYIGRMQQVILDPKTDVSGLITASDIEDAAANG